MKKFLLMLIMLSTGTGIAMADIGYNLGIGYQVATVLDLENGNGQFLPFGLDINAGLGVGWGKDNVQSAGLHLNLNFIHGGEVFFPGIENVFNATFIISILQARAYYAYEFKERQFLIPFAGVRLATDMIHLPKPDTGGSSCSTSPHGADFRGASGGYSRGCVLGVHPLDLITPVIGMRYEWSFFYTEFVYHYSWGGNYHILELGIGIKYRGFNSGYDF